jgi:hypothetical protein
MRLLRTEEETGDVLLRKFLYGPGIDQPICMIEGGGSYAGAYYYHFDGLGSVVALSDADGETVQTYEYSIYGEPDTSAPSVGSAAPPSFSSGVTVKRSVNGPTEEITFFTDLPATTMSPDWPRTTSSARIRPAPRAPRCFRTTRRDR